MRFLFLGDVVGRPGREVVTSRLPKLRERWKLDFVVINGENAAGGFGITEAICDEFCDAGADVVTLGNHSFDQREALVFIERAPRLIRPANYPPARRAAAPALMAQDRRARPRHQRDGPRVHGPARRSLRRGRPRARRLSAREQARRGRDATFTPRRRARSRPSGIISTAAPSLVVGTHTHVPTSDHRMLAGGTAYVSDIGMCGDYDSVLGMDEGGADPPLPHQDPVVALRAGERRGHVGGRCGRDQ